MQELSKKIAFAFYKNQADPFSRKQFPHLSEIALDVIAENFELHPTLGNLDPYFKTQVTPSPLASPSTFLSHLDSWHSYLPPSWLFE